MRGWWHWLRAWPARRWYRQHRSMVEWKRDAWKVEVKR